MERHMMISDFCSGVGSAACPYDRYDTEATKALDSVSYLLGDSRRQFKVCA